jgi:hypothetical protein
MAPSLAARKHRIYSWRTRYQNNIYLLEPALFFISVETVFSYLSLSTGKFWPDNAVFDFFSFVE